MPTLTPAQASDGALPAIPAVRRGWHSRTGRAGVSAVDALLPRVRSKAALRGRCGGHGRRPHRRLPNLAVSIGGSILIAVSFGRQIHRLLLPLAGSANLRDKLAGGIAGPFLSEPCLGISNLNGEDGFALRAFAERHNWEFPRPGGHSFVVATLVRLRTTILASREIRHRGAVQ